MLLSLQTLPIEISDEELFFAASNICQRWNAILNSYRQFQAS